MDLRLYDGTTTLNLSDGTAFAVPYDSWSPNVARLRADALGGRSPYAPVEEAIPLHARGSTGAAALANVQTLARMMDQAARWWRGEDVNAVILQYKPTGSTLGGYLKNAVVPADRSGLVGLSPRVNDAGNYEIPGLTLNLLRVEGQWLFDEYDVENHVLNSSFELFSGGAFTDWLDTTGVTLSQVSALTHGSYAARVVVGGGVNVGIYQDVSLTNGTTYTVSAYVRRISGSSNVSLIAEDNGGGNSVSTTTTSSDVVRLSVQKVAASGGIRVSIRTSSSTTFEVDAVMIEEGSSATDYHPNSDEVFIATANNTGNPHELVADWSVSGIESELCPVNLELDFLQTPSGTNNFYADGALIHKTGATAGNVTIVEAEDAAIVAPGSGTFAVHTDADARGGEVRQLIANSTGEYTLTESSVSGQGERYGVWVHCRSYASVSYTMQASVLSTGSGVEMSPPPVIFNPADSKPQYVYLGTIVIDVDDLARLRVTIEPSATTSDALEIDFMLVAPLSEWDGVIVLPAKEFSTGPFEAKLSLDGGALVSPKPTITAGGTGIGTTQVLAWLGNAYFVADGMEFSITPLLTSEKWTYTDYNGNVVDFEITATRKLAYLTPE